MTESEWYEISFLDLDYAEYRAKLASQLRYGNFTVYPLMPGSAFNYILKRGDPLPGAIVSYRNGVKTYPNA